MLTKCQTPCEFVNALGIIFPNVFLPIIVIYQVQK